MGILPIYIYGYNNEHDVIVFMVFQDIKWSFQSKTGSVAFSKVSVLVRLR